LLLWIPFDWSYKTIELASPFTRPQSTWLLFLPFLKDTWRSWFIRKNCRQEMNCGKLWILLLAYRTILRAWKRQQVPF
jgi:hypothetical protein